jgi:hypothetical protein
VRKDRPADPDSVIPKRPRGEGQRDLADVIIAGARQTAQFGRDAIYALSGYEDDLMPHGCTRPDSRIPAS